MRAFTVLVQIDSAPIRYSGATLFFGKMPSLPVNLADPQFRVSLTRSTLQQLLTNANPNVRREATNALVKISPR